jgi:tetratricopeptide (TPR) repeat protein
MSQQLILRSISVIVLFSVLTIGLTQTVKPGQTPESKIDTRVEPTTWGHVFGRIYDSSTGLPIRSAKVFGYTDNGFEEKGRSTGVSDATGEYRIQLILGRISENFDLGRALLSSPLGMLFGTATNKTKRIDVSRVAVLVSAPGYKPFRGIVSARSTDASKFRIDVEPILLVPEGKEGASVAARGWNSVRILETTSTPPIARPKDKVVFSCTIRASSDEFAKSTEVSAFSDLWKGAKKLKHQEGSGATGRAVFTGEYVVSGREKRLANPVWFAVTKAKVDYDPARSWRVVVVNISPNGDDRTQAEERIKALEFVAKGQTADARNAFAALVKGGSNQPYDWTMSAQLSLKVGDPVGAVEPLSKLWADNPKDKAAGASYLQALYQSGLDSQVILVGEQLTKGVKEKDLPKALAPQSLAYVGLSMIRTEDLAGADRVSEQLLAFPASGIDETVIEFRGKLRLAEVQKRHSGNPSSPSALADYGRALLDLGRFEEAVAKLSEAAQIDPSQATIQQDIAWAALQMRGGRQPEINIEQAVAEAKSQLGLEKGQQRSKDFFSWNQYGLLLFAWSEQKRISGAADAQAVRDEAITAIREALSLGRVGAKRNPGYFSGFTYSYMSGSEVAISGFAYPQANSSFLLLESLKRLRRNENDQVALLNAASALLDLGQISLASLYCDRLLNQDALNVEAKLIRALILRQRDQTEDARDVLLELVQIAPNHPRANLVVADILTELGDPVAAAERAAIHASFYGEIEK